MSDSDVIARSDNEAVPTQALTGFFEVLVNNPPAIVAFDAESLREDFHAILRTLAAAPREGAPYDGTFRTMPVPPHVCNPPEPTYGPLTVEMVADALLHVVMELKLGESESEAQAHFVLRLLNEAQPCRLGPELFGDAVCAVDVRDWLFSLARERRV